MKLSDLAMIISSYSPALQRIAANLGALSGILETAATEGRDSLTDTERATIDEIVRSSEADYQAALDDARSRLSS